MTTREDQLMTALLSPRYDHGIRSIAGLAQELQWDASAIRAAVQLCPDIYEYDSVNDRLRIRRAAVSTLPPERLNRIGQDIQA